MSNFSETNSKEKTLEPVKELQHFYKVLRKSYDFIQKKLEEKVQQRNDDLTTLLED